MKRLFDMLVSSVLLVATAPLMLIVAIAVRRSSLGPIIFRQERIGRHGKPFTILKFRTMGPASASDREITVGNDRRITRVGHILRKWKVDELPQLVNVLCGDMSLVGPRPDVPFYVAQYPADLRAKVLSVRPGVTDSASIKYRNENDLLAEQADSQLQVGYAHRPILYQSLVHKTQK